MKAPQIIMIVWMAINLVLQMILNGETTEQKHSFGSQLIGTLILVGILYWGGFWNC